MVTCAPGRGRVVGLALLETASSKVIITQWIFIFWYVTFVAALPWWFSPGIPIAVRTWSPVYVMYWPEKHDRFHQLVKQGHVTPLCMWYTPCDRDRVWWVAVIWAWHDEVEAKHNKERFPTHVCKLQIMQTLQPFSVGKTKDATLAVVNDLKSSILKFLQILGKCSQEPVRVCFV